MSDRQFVEAILNEPGSPGIVSEAETTSNEGGDTSDPGSDVQKFIDRLLDTLGDDSANEGSEAPQ